MAKNKSQNPNKFIVLADGSHAERTGKSSIGGIVLKLDFRQSSPKPQVINIFSLPLPPNESSMSAEFHACAHGLSLIKKPRDVMLINDLQQIKQLIETGELEKWVAQQKKKHLRNGGAALLHEISRHKLIRPIHIKDGDLELLKACHHLAKSGRKGIVLSTASAELEISERDLEILAQFPNIQSAVKKARPHTRKAPGDKGTRGQKTKRAILASLAEARSDVPAGLH